MEPTFCAENAAFEGFALRFLPWFRLAQHPGDDHRQDRREGAREENKSPSGIPVVEIRLAGRDRATQQRAGDVASAESACIAPRAIGRIRAGTLSASRVVAAPNIPPIPSPPRNR